MGSEDAAKGGKTWASEQGMTTKAGVSHKNDIFQRTWCRWPHLQHPQVCDGWRVEPTGSRASWLHSRNLHCQDVLKISPPRLGKTSKRPAWRGRARRSKWSKTVLEPCNLTPFWACMSKKNNWVRALSMYSCHHVSSLSMASNKSHRFAFLSPNLWNRRRTSNSGLLQWQLILFRLLVIVRTSRPELLALASLFAHLTDGFGKTQKHQCSASTLHRASWRPNRRSCDLGLCWTWVN